MYAQNFGSFHQPQYTMYSNPYSPPPAYPPGPFAPQGPNAIWYAPYPSQPWATMGNVYGKGPEVGPPVMPPHSRRMQQSHAMGLHVVPPQPGQHGMNLTSLSPLPTSPRGPPCKPRQSGWAVWVGNLAVGTTVIHLKDFFSDGAANDIVSVFSISKTNCAFVNYRTEQACRDAIRRFDNAQFRGNWIVCRIRQDSGKKGKAASPSSQLQLPTPEDSLNSGSGSEQSVDAHDMPLIVGGPPKPKPAAASPKPAEPTSLPVADLRSLSIRPKVDTRVFILKSLTQQDLLVSMRDKTWVTQPHNEEKLNEAFAAADNVYLVFSVNKSGQYFGYARMESAIPLHANPAEPKSSSTGSPLRSLPREQCRSQADGLPMLILTPATATAPKGRVTDDSARETVFWEAEVTEDDEKSAVSGNSDKADTEETLAPGGKQFAIRWISTIHIPFHATRGLRNRLNHNREVKIARDGTEVDMWTASCLIELFHPPGVSVRPVLGGGQC